MITLSVIALIVFAAAIGWLLFNKLLDRREGREMTMQPEPMPVEDVYGHADLEARLSFYRAQRQMFRDVEAAKGETPPWRQ